MQVPPRSPAGRCSGSGAEQTSLQEEGARKHPGKPGAEGTCQNGNKKPKTRTFEATKSHSLQHPGAAGSLARWLSVCLHVPSARRTPQPPHGAAPWGGDPTTTGIKNQLGPVRAALCPPAGGAGRAA